MDSDNKLNKVSFWLQEAKELMLAADLCWRSDASFLKLIEEGRLQGLNNTLLKMEVDGEVELNWLYNVLAGLAVYYLAVAVLLGREPERTFDPDSERHIIELVEACGIELQPKQSEFLQRVQDALAMTDKENQWNITLSSQDLKTMKQRYASQHAVDVEAKLAIDGLMGVLINSALDTLSAAAESEQGGEDV